MVQLTCSALTKLIFRILCVVGRMYSRCVVYLQSANVNGKTRYGGVLYRKTKTGYPYASAEKVYAEMERFG